ncbi:LysR family transcriptional regulator [Micromonospora sp. NPDC047557]|uniref:LysR family transcriptional regulator n=1 Tax=Micromonospora sp. NPDC047557 TaxID=3364250 RepID=UPI0037185D3A
MAQLQLVVAVADSGAFTAAAERALISQPALSRAVKDVERVLGVRLFDRTTRSVALTADGREFVPVAREIIAGAANGLARFQAYRDGHHGAVTVAALPALAACVLPFTCRRLAEQRPHIRVRVIEADAAQVLGHIRSGRADIAVTEAPESAADLHIQPIGDDRTVAVAPTGHPLTATATISWQEWARHPAVAYRGGPDLPVGMNPQVAFEADTAATVVAMVAAGLGVAAMPLSALPLTDQKSITVIPLTDPLVSKPLAVVRRTVPAITPSAEALLEILRTVRFDPLNRRAPELGSAPKRFQHHDESMVTVDKT